MIITFCCPSCSAQLNFSDLSQNESPCPCCNRVITLQISQKMRRENIADQCAICGLEKLYIQKDFNRTLGISILTLAAMISLVLYGYNHILSAFAVLGGVAAVDYLLYLALPEVTICYRCHSQYREVSSYSTTQPFELELAEKYDPKDKRKEAENPAAGWRQH